MIFTKYSCVTREKAVKRLLLYAGLHNIIYIMCRHNSQKSRNFVKSIDSFRILYYIMATLYYVNCANSLRGRIG